MTTPHEDPFVCMDCRVDTSAINEYYMVNDSLWKVVTTKRHDSDGMLCIACLEARIGRKLVPADFTAAPINSGTIFELSERLIDRLNPNRRAGCRR